MLLLNPQYGLRGGQIEIYLKSQKNFKGCFPIDQIPVFTSFPAYIIVNTALAKSPGEHWIALIIRKTEFLYFDSYGLGVMNYRLFQYFKRYDGNRPIIHSKICIQSLTSYSCGLFVTAFVKNVKSIKSYHLFMGKFNHENLPINDLIVYSLL